MSARSRTAAALVLGLCLFLGIARPAETLPGQLNDEAFWKIVSDFSEPGGTFLSDNWVSNERSFQHVLGELAQGRVGTGAYIGVGPEQNFTYIMGLKPQIAFIIDIRRQNMIEHLVYKALFELSSDRIDFLSRLFSRPRPPEITKDSHVIAVFEGFGAQPPQFERFEETLAAVKDKLVKGHGFTLTAEDTRTLEFVLRAFLVGGPNLTYNGPRTGTVVNVIPGMFIMPTIGEIMVETTKEGEYRSFLATEANFQTVREMHRKNLIVPVVGDFGGPTAIRSVGQFLRDRNVNVSAFYTSNVEQYLFMNADSWEKFYQNVSTLPVDSKSVFVRGLIRTVAGDYSPSPAMAPTSKYETRLFSIADLVAKLKAGNLNTYGDVVGPPN